MIQIHPRLTPSLCEELIDFLKAQPAACPELHPGWLEALRRGLNHQPLVLIDRAGSAGEIRGVLPLCWVRSRLFGSFLVSLPYLNRAGVVGEDAAAEHRLIDAACGLARDGRADYLELRQSGAAREHGALSSCRADKPRLVMDLPASDTALWDGLKAKVRNQIRKAERYEPEVVIGGHELLGDFYAVFAETMRDLGTPVYPRRFFGAILASLPGHAELVVLRQQGHTVAGAALIHDPVHGAITQVPSAACLRSANPTNANMGLYHALLRRAIERGASRFDFGRSSPDSGTFRFKRQWGAEPEPVVWQQMPLHGSTMAARPDNPKYRSRIEAWRRLPVWVTRLIGPPIVRGIP
jgi:FemAB-related protein (PEP-CTERM system-associated)